MRYKLLYVTEIYSLIDHDSESESVREYYEICGRLRYYQRNWNDSVSCFNKVIECVKSTETAKHRHVTALIYLGKIMYSEQFYSKNTSKKPIDH